MLSDKLGIMGISFTLYGEKIDKLCQCPESEIDAVFKERMKRLYCFTKKKFSCDECSFSYKCSAHLLLTPEIFDETGKIQNPYIIRSCIITDNIVCFQMLFYGFQRMLIADIQRVFDKGIFMGKQNTQYILMDMHDATTGIKLMDDENMYAPKIMYAPPARLNGNSLVIDFFSPFCCHKHKGDIDFEFIIRACMKRIKSVFKQCDIAFEHNEEWLYSRARKIQTTRHLRSEKVFPYNPLTKVASEKAINGFVGTLTFSGQTENPFKPFAEIIGLCEMLNIGDYTGIGLGYFKVRYTNKELRLSIK